MDKIMAERRNGLGFRGGTAGTGAGFLAGSRTGWVRSLFPISPAVSRRILGDMFAADFVTTDGTADHFIITAGGGAGAGDFIFAGRHRRNMSAGDRYFVCVQLHCTLAVAEAFLTAGTGPIFWIAVFRTGFFFCGMMDEIVAERRNGLGFGIGTAGTGASFFAGNRAGWICSLLPLSPVVPRGILGDMFAADLLTAS